MFGVIATAFEVANFLGAVDLNSFIPSDPSFYRFTQQMTSRFHMECKRSFLPVRKSNFYRYPSDTPDPVSGFASTLRLDEDLLSVVSLKTQNGNVTIGASDIHLLNGPSYNKAPYDTIELKTDGTNTTFSFSGSPQRSQEVDGIWGFHNEWSDAWQQEDQVQDNPLTAAATTILVADADAKDKRGFRPRFMEQQLLRLGTTDTSEMVYVTDINYTTNVLTVTRGVNGSTAAQVALNTDIYVFRPHHELTYVVNILTSHAYRRKDTVGREGVDVQIMGTGIIVMPSKLPLEVVEALQIYKKSLRILY